MPSCTATRQLCRLGIPSISTRHSKQAPIMQYGARGAPDTGVARNRWTPAASSAAATERPPGTLSGWSLNQIWRMVGSASAWASVPVAGESTLNSGFEVIVGQVEAKRNVGVQDASRGTGNGEPLLPEPMQSRR